MRVVLAPNAFKGTFDAVEVVEIAASALADRPDVEVDARPLSDGGDGFLRVVRRYRPGVLEVHARARDPLGRPIAAPWGWDPDRDEAWIESAAAIGLRHLEGGERDPLVASTAGLGPLLAAAIGARVRRITVGLGGSATVDGGAGMARALGFRLEDAAGRPMGRAADLVDLARIVAPERPPAGGVEVVALADVDHPLLGPAGAAAAFGPQKGADEAGVRRLEAGLGRLAGRWIEDLGAPADVTSRPGAGAAGGLGAGCVAFLGATLASGADACARLAGLAGALAAADAVVTAEARFDAQSGGKATGRVLALARAAGKPAAVLCASGEGGPAGALVVDARVIGLPPGAELDREAIARLVQRAVDLLVDRGDAT